MPENYQLSYVECRKLLWERIAEAAPGRIQLLSGPRQVGKTTLLLELLEKVGKAAIYAAADSPEASLPGFWERIWTRAEEVASGQGRAILLLDEVHLFQNWAARLKGEWDRIRRRRIPVHVIATGSSALRLGRGTRESLAGRFERITLAHWSASSLAEIFQVSQQEAVDSIVRQGAYPGAFGLRSDLNRWSAYVRDAIVDPAIGRDILAIEAVRKPALLRQVFAICASSPAQVISLQKLQGQLQEAGALDTIAHYLTLLQEAYLVAPLEKFSARAARRRAAPPKVISLSNAFLAVVEPQRIPDPGTDPARFGVWVENACLAHACNSGQQVSYWREDPLEVDGVIEGSWGSWAIEVKTGTVESGDLRGLLEFVRRHRRFRPLIIGAAGAQAAGERAGVDAMTWRTFLLTGPPGGASGR